MTDDYQSQPDGSVTIEDPLGGEGAPMTPAIETVFDLLADEERREGCLFLMDSSVGVVRLDEIAAALATDADDRERLAIDLHHRHLPKLAAAGIIAYDARSNTVRYWGQPTVEKWAEHIRAVDDRAE